MASLPFDSSLLDSAALRVTIEPLSLPVAAIDANAPKAGMDWAAAAEGPEALVVVTAVTLDIAKGFGFVPLLRGIAPNNPPVDDDDPKSGVSLEEAVLLLIVKPGRLCVEPTLLETPNGFDVDPSFLVPFPKPKSPPPKADPNNGFDIDEVEDKLVANEVFSEFCSLEGADLSPNGFVGVEVPPKMDVFVFPEVPIMGLLSLGGIENRLEPDGFVVGSDLKDDADLELALAVVRALNAAPKEALTGGDETPGCF